MTVVSRISDHVEDRWPQRSDDPIMDPLHAWLDSEEIPGGHGLEGDEIRWNEHTGTVLIRCDETLVTVLDEDDLQSRARFAVEWRRSA